MKIVLISGMSGVGKTTICKNLCERYDDKFNFVNSYTDRERRTPKEWGHEFVDTQMMDALLKSSDIVARTDINQYRYCTLKSQFDKNKINLYTVDVKGINDTIKAFPQADFMTILVRRNEIEADCIRENRDVQVPVRDDVDFVIENNRNVESSANLLNTLINFDFFNKPSHVITTLNDKIEYVNTQCRLIKDIRSSLYEQLWYANEPIYRHLCAFVEDRINNEFDFDIRILSDDEPVIYDGDLQFSLQGEYDEDDLAWTDIYSLVDRMSYHAHTFCKENECYDMEYRLSISEKWKGEDNYV